MAPDSVAFSVASPVVSSVVSIFPLLALLGDGPTPFCELVRPDAMLATQRGLAETSPGYRLPHLKAALARGWVAVAAVSGEPAGEDTPDGPPDVAWPHYRDMAQAPRSPALEVLAEKLACWV